MQRSEKERLLEEAKCLIRQSELKEWEKENLNRNIDFFLSHISKDTYLSQCKWSWFDEEDDGHGLDLLWDWKDVKGCFGFYTDNGHGFSFDYGENGECFQFGGEGGDHGFSCCLFIDELETQLSYMGY